MERDEDFMAEIRFKGKELQIPEIGQFWIPTAKVELISEKRNYLCEMIVDSGADITLVPRSLGEFLGLSFQGEKIREIRGIGEGTIPYVIKTVETKIGNFKFESRIGVTLIEEVPLILGRLDIFDNFNIEFRQKEKITIFRKVPRTVP